MARAELTTDEPIVDAHRRPINSDKPTFVVAGKFKVGNDIGIRADDLTGKIFC